MYLIYGILPILNTSKTVLIELMTLQNNFSILLNYHAYAYIGANFCKLVNFVLSQGIEFWQHHS